MASKSTLGLKLQLVSVNRTNWDRIMDIRNEPCNFMSFSSGMVEPIEHYAHMSKYSTDYRLCATRIKDKLTYVGFIGVVEGDLRICVSEEYKEQGIGTFMMNNFCSLGGFEVKVLADNDESLAFFESLGYEKKYHLMEK